MADKTLDVTFSMMPKVKGMTVFGDRLIMYDNISKPFCEAVTPEIEVFYKSLPKRMDFVVILVCIKGSIKARCNLREFSIKPNDVFLLVPGTICESLDISPDASVIVIALPDSSYAPSSSFENATYVPKNFTSPKCVSLDANVVESGLIIYRQMKSSLSSGNVSEDLIKAYIMLFAGLAAGNIQKWMEENPENDRKKGKETILKEFLTRVESEHREHKDVTWYAEAAGLSPKYFAKQIYNQSGKHPLDWIREYVILDVQAMLKSREHSIDEICELLHFSSRSQFNRYFKDATGVSPTEYLKAK